MQTQLKPVPRIEPTDYPTNIINMRYALDNIREVVGELIEEQERQSSLNNGMAKSLQECKSNFDGINMNFQTLFDFMDKQTQPTNAEPEAPKFEPGEDYYYITSDGIGLEIQEETWEGDAIDRERMREMPLFRSEEEATVALEEVISMLHKYR